MSHLVSQLLPASRDPSTPALRLPQQTLTYGDVADLSARFAALLIDLGIRKGDRVAVQAPKCVETLMLYLGCLRTGAVFLPLNTGYTPAEVDYFLRDSEPALFVAAHDAPADILAVGSQGSGSRVETLGPGVGSLLSHLPGAAPKWRNVRCDRDDLAAILYTSGTTGRPKGAMLTQENLASNARVLVEAWAIAKSDALIHALPVFHAHGLFVAVNTLMSAGGSMIFQPRFEVDAVLSALGQATVLMGVPTFYTRLLDDPRLDRAAACGMRLFISGSAPLSSEVHRQFENRTGHRILERYGMTETGMLTSNPCSGDRRAGSVGLALSGVKLRAVRQEDDQTLGRGDIGVVQVRGPNVFVGYWRMPDKTAADFTAEGWFVTGDLGRLDDDGYLWLVGRQKDLIISGGYNVYPAEVEAALDALDGVRESAVIGVPHRDFGEAVVAVVVLQPGTPHDVDGIAGELRGRLAGYKIPKKIFFREELPRNTMSKVLKSELRAEYGAVGNE